MKYKMIYKVLYPVGFEEIKVAEDYKTEVPYTEVKPLALENSQSQYFDFANSIWKEAVTQDNSAKLVLIESLHSATNEKLVKLEEKSTKQEEEILNTQMAVAELYEQGGTI